MDTTPFDSLREMDLRFYERVGTSFSKTRDHPWPGWECLAQALERHLSEQARLLDLACGNGRFEEFLAQRFVQTAWSATCIDACQELLSECGARCKRISSGNLACETRLHDILAALRPMPCDDAKGDASDSLGISSNWFNFVCCFGFFHHVPTQAMRRRLLQLMMDAAQPGGFVAASFWRFADEPAFAEKARQQTETALSTCAGHGLSVLCSPASLEEGDYLMGWQGSLDALRYCHSFSTEEIDGLIDSQMPASSVVARFRADGRTEALNEYIVLRKNDASI